MSGSGSKRQRTMEGKWKHDKKLSLKGRNPDLHQALSKSPVTTRDADISEPTRLAAACKGWSLEVERLMSRSHESRGSYIVPTLQQVLRVGAVTNFQRHTRKTSLHIFRRAGSQTHAGGSQDFKKSKIASHLKADPALYLLQSHSIVMLVWACLAAGGAYLAGHLGKTAMAYANAANAVDNSPLPLSRGHGHQSPKLRRELRFLKYFYSMDSLTYFFKL
ncbi:hypothetical protein BKA70DRAFT_1460132 [Coprinopsis sp. MPI-PUGE-AT-0042]|nr:hypothetical protein BKA70DRAFT_1460132 [Coprinopsis sp. MPI-PUGE-AT-0042]